MSEPGDLLLSTPAMALAPRIGRLEAQRIVKAICDHAVTSGKSLRQAAQADEQVRVILSLEEIDQALDPSRYLGSTDVFINRALAAYHEVQSSRGGV